MNFFNMIRGWIPTGTEVQIGSITSAIGAVLTYFIGWNDALEALLTLMVIDYATGLLAAYINPDLKLDSHKGFRGICKKIVIILLIVLAHELEKATGVPAVQSVVVWFFVGNEGLSIIENSAKAGVPVPEKLWSDPTRRASGNRWKILREDGSASKEGDLYGRTA